MNWKHLRNRISELATACFVSTFIRRHTAIQHSEMKQSVKGNSANSIRGGKGSSERVPYLLTEPF